MNNSDNLLHHSSPSYLLSCNRAIKSDMALGEEYVSGVTDKYYDLDDSSVKIQAEIHGER